MTEAEERALAEKGHLGVYVYCGTNQTKKTTSAVEDAFRDRDATGWGILALESQAVWNFERWRHAATFEEAIDRAWGRYSNKKGEVIAYVPKNAAEVVSIYQAVRGGKRVHVIHDEIRFYMSCRKCPDEIVEALRVWPHIKASFRLVTQRIGDIHGDARACATEIYAFRTVLDADKETLRKEYGVPAEIVENLHAPEGQADPRCEFVRVRKGAYVQGVVSRGGDSGKRKEAEGAALRPAGGEVPAGGLRPAGGGGKDAGAPVDRELYPEPPGAGAGGVEAPASDPS